MPKKGDFKNLTNQKFQRWTVESFHGIGNNRHPLWNCICECGSRQVISGASLRCAATGGCRECRHKRMLVVQSSHYWHYIKANARNRNINFNLDREKTFQLLKNQNNKCALSGLNIQIAIGQRNHMHGETTASLDRIDSKRGYENDNIQWVHKDVNRMKSILSQERFIELCKLIGANHET